MANKLIIAAAGSGKTTFLIREALKVTDQMVLITTYTEANGAEIRKKIIEENKFIPSNIVVQTWFSFLLQHGVRPYQGCLFKHAIKGMTFVDSQSARYVRQSDIGNFYFDAKHKIYSDKIAWFLINCNVKCSGLIVNRLARIYSYIFIDEVQDLSGYDLEFLKLLFASTINTVLVGDPRQGTYSTSNIAKNKQFRNINIGKFFDDPSLNIVKDDSSFITNYRSISKICDLSNRLFPDHPSAKSGNPTTTNHDGIFLVRECDIDYYLSTYTPMQLRISRSKTIENNMPIMNFGGSKGLSFERVLIYPTKPILVWLKNNTNTLEEKSRSQLYVAITRAKFSVAFAYDYKDNEDIPGTEKFVRT